MAHLRHLLRAGQQHGLALSGHLPWRPGMAIRSGGCGFFGDVFMAINGVRFAERHGLPCRIDWLTGSLYAELGQQSNPWQDFFVVDRWDFSAGHHLAGLWLPYRPGAEAPVAYAGLTVRQSAHRLLHAYAQPKVEILAAVAAFAAEHFAPAGMLGVHVRLTDAAQGREGRRVVGLADFLAEAEVSLEAHLPAGAGIFLASDDARVIDAFTDRFGTRVVAQACLRSIDGTSIHGHYDGGVAGSAYRKGFEVLMDALLLARCRHLVRTHSRVGAFALCWNPQLTRTDLDTKLLGVDRLPWLEGVAPDAVVRAAASSAHVT